MLLGLYREGAQAARLAIEKAPSSAEAHCIVGRLLAECGHFPEALTRLEIARTIDPRVLITIIESARIHALLGEWERVDKLLEMAGKASDDSPYFYWGSVLRLHLWRKDPAKARTIAGAARASAQGGHPFVRGMIAVLEGGYPQPRSGEFLDTANTARRRVLMFQARAEIAGYRHELEDAVASVEAAYSHGLTDTGWLTHCPVLTLVRDDPRFATVILGTSARAKEVIAELHLGRWSVRP
jgi:hypothetical protein